MRSRKRRGGRREQSPKSIAPHPSDGEFNPEPISHFSNWVSEKRKLYCGRDVVENQANYIPPNALFEYWTPRRISKVQHPPNGKPLSFNIETIRSRYLRTFSTLVFCQRITSLDRFTSLNLNDDRLPLKVRPEEWPKDPFHDKLFTDICDHQWLFFPVIFAPNQLEDRHLHESRVLPIEKLEQLAHDGDSVIRTITIHDSCNNLASKDKYGRPTQRVFVLKSYHDSRFESRYLNEVRALIEMRNSPSPHVITFYGSFRQYGHYNLILEHADGGNLADFFRDTSPPRNADVALFWKSLSQVLRGLDRVHHLMMVVDHSVNGIHEDIKPDNILLFKGSSKSPYEFTAKIADFGLFSHVRESRVNSRDAMGLDNHGNQRYSSPECSHYRPGQQGVNMITTRADIFSMGAVLSDACAWVEGGHKRQAQYLKQRTDHHETMPAFKGSGYKGCFHDGIKRLPVVDEVHTDIRKRQKKVHDHITPEVCDIVETCMLRDNASDRLNARAVMEKFEQLLDMTLDDARPPPTEAPPPLEEVDAASCPIPSGGLALLGAKIQAHKVANPDRTHPLSAPLREEITKLGDELKLNVTDRNHLLFFDDSTSMAPRANAVHEAAAALLEVARELDPHRVEALFASEAPSRLHRLTGAPHLDRLLEDRPYRRAPGMMEDCFGRLVDDVLVPRLPWRFLGRWWFHGLWSFFGLCWWLTRRRRTSVYVFTDGDWGRDGKGACGVERPLKRLTKELQDRGLDRNLVSFHFVKFGESEAGADHLEFLDTYGRPDWDVVDVKLPTSPVQNIIIGPLSQWNDEIGESD